MFADTNTGSLCAAMVIEIAAAKQRMAQMRMVIGIPFGRGLYPGFADLQRMAVATNRELPCSYLLFYGR